MNSQVSNFFSRDVFLKRQARTRKASSHTRFCSSSLKSRPLHIIPEEEDYSSSSSRSPSPMPPYTSGASAGSSQTLGVESKRRHANVTVSDIRVARTAYVHHDNDISEQNPTLLSAPRPAPRPPTSRTSPTPSPDPFSLTFTDLSFKFPHPPIPTPSSIVSFDRTSSQSPTPSMSASSTSTSPDSSPAALPTTPSSSDDELSSYYSSSLPNFNARRASIKPLVISKRNSASVSSTSEHLESPISASLLQPFKNTEEYEYNTAPLSPLSSEDSSSDSEESDSEWYTREFSKVLTFYSIPTNSPGQSQHLHPARPESILVPALSPSPEITSPHLIAGYPSAQLDPAFPRKRRSRGSIPRYPPPPVPSIPAHLRASSVSPPPSPSLKSTSRSSARFISPRSTSFQRPPPRSSIPADCVCIDESYAFSDDSESSFSFSLYHHDDMMTTGSGSPTSLYSQPSPYPSPLPASFPSTPSFPSDAGELDFDFPIDEIEFDVDMDRSLMLPLSLPCSPIDLEADIANGLAELRLGAGASCVQEQVESRELDHKQHPPHGDTPSLPPNDDAEACSAGDSDMGATRALRSRWSSSTLSSIREDHERRGASARLRSYFGVAIAGSYGSVRTKSALSWKATPPTTPTSPSRRFRSGRKESYVYAKRESDVDARRESDVMVIGYGQGQGVRRRGSVTPTVSDVGSEESTSSSGSAGLRRKPIPVEMFLRTAA